MDKKELSFKNFVRKYSNMTNSFMTLPRPQTLEEFEVFKERFSKELDKVKNPLKKIPNISQIRDISIRKGISIEDAIINEAGKPLFENDLFKIIQMYNTYSISFGFNPITFGKKNPYDGNMFNITGRFRNSRAYLTRDTSRYTVNLLEVWSANIPYVGDPNGTYDDRPVIVMWYNFTNQMYSVLACSSSVTEKELNNYSYIVKTDYPHAKYVYCNYAFFLSKRHFRELKGSITYMDYLEYCTKVAEYQYQFYNNIPTERERTLMSMYR